MIQGLFAFRKQYILVANDITSPYNDPYIEYITGKSFKNAIYNYIKTYPKQALTDNIDICTIWLPNALSYIHEEEDDETFINIEIKNLDLDMCAFALEKYIIEGRGMYDYNFNVNVYRIYNTSLHPLTKIGQ